MKKETLEREYLENGLTQKQIAEKYNISRVSVVRLMQEYGISTRPPYLRRSPELEDAELTELEEQFLLGKLLGDGSIYLGNSSLNYRLGFAHCVKQKEYIEYCYSFITRWCSQPPQYREQKRDPKVYKTDTLKKYVLESKSHPEFGRLHRYIYEHGRKVINKDILSSLTPLSWAIWYQDDGSLETDHRTGNVTGMKLHTNQFPKESVDLIVSWLKTEYGINATANKSQVGKDGITQYCVRISKSSIVDFSNLIRPHVHPSMTYKIVDDIVRPRQ